MLYVLNSSFISERGEIPFEQIGDHYETKDHKRVDDELNKQAMDDHYFLVWSKDLNMTRGLHLNVGKPVNHLFVVVQNTPVKVFRGIVTRFYHLGNLHLVDVLFRRELNDSVVIKNDMEIMVGHKVTLTNEYEKTVYVEYYGQLGHSIPPIPEQYSSALYMMTDHCVKKVVFNNNSVITEDTEITISAVCKSMNPAECATTKTCMHFCKCLEKSTAISVIVVGSFVIFASIGVCVFIVMTKVMKKKQQIGGYQLLESDLFKTKGSNTAITIPIHGQEMDLHLMEEIGRGTYGSVWKAQNEEGDQLFAVKIQTGGVAQERGEAQKEAMLLEQLDTQFVVAVYGCVCTNRTMAIAMEFFALGSLQNVLQQDKLPSNARVPMLLDIAKAMDYLHSLAIIHRDLKPGNVLVCSVDPNVHPMSKFVSFLKRHKQHSVNPSQYTTHRISDFGEARTVESMEASMTMTSGVGTPFYMAPEMATGAKHYTGAVDVYSFGILAAQVMVGSLVYDSSDAFETQYGLFSITVFFFFFHNQTKPLCLFPLSFTCILFSIPKTRSICECSVPRTSTSCVWLFSQDEITDDCMLGCQPLFSSLFVFISSLHPLVQHFFILVFVKNSI